MLTVFSLILVPIMWTDNGPNWLLQTEGEVCGIPDACAVFAYSAK